ncbi:MAG: L,D-transpeptidase family protein [Gammaproteobacteria bacterium]|nr:L,D-transpeptidase family protein [Gammaproteobacteria bacterium]MBT8444846.1 L,D-transpeptidase family protein [Gammaproteobacteria bacterium]NND36459.1 L,D-transpeptidase family protein [Gammaproteobacteria bacterium]
MSLFVKYLAILLLLITPVWPASAADDAVAAALASRIGALSETPRATLRGVALQGAALFADFYARRDMQPAWTRPARVDELIALLANAGDEGLLPSDYLLDEIAALRGEIEHSGSPAATADLDILLTAALTRYGYHLAFGKVDNRELDPNINFRREISEGEDPAVTIQQAIDAPSLQAFFATEIPRGPVYARLREILVEYREIAAAGTWVEVPEGPTLRSGDSGRRVAALRRRLAASDDLPDGASATGDAFDESLQTGVRIFQERHALDTDGAVGPATLAAINVPIETRIEQLRLSLERLRWIRSEIGEQFLVVNIAGFRVVLWKDNDFAWRGRAMVGKTYRQTPVFRGDIRYLEMNPTWTIPPGILRNDTLPAIKRDPNYLADRNISVIDRDGRKVHPSMVDWTMYTRGVPYTLRQEPGPNNALGRIKFIFPNEHFVFLHDTPSRYLFDRAERAFSSGCIRVENPFELAELLLDEPDQWNQETLQAVIDGAQTQRVYLDDPMPVLILYLTASIEPDGRPRFLKDIYSRDAKLLAALNAPPQLYLPVAG